MPLKEYIILNRKDSRTRVITGKTLAQALAAKRLRPDLWLEISQPYLTNLQRKK